MTERAMLDEPRAGRLTIHYRPETGDDIVENPPRFTWLPVLDPEARYILRISQDPDFPKDATRVYDNIPMNFFTPDTPLAPGVWYWDYAECATGSTKPRTNWSTRRQFALSENLPETPLPDRATRLSSCDTAHPRLWLNPKGLSEARASVKADPTVWSWDVFFEKSVLPWMDTPIITEPEGYPNHKRTAPVWRSTYIACQELIYAIRHLAIGGQMTQDTAMLDQAKDWLLEAARWNPAGTTSRAYSDEWAFRVNVALAWGYDWLYDHLSEDERVTVRTALVTRTRETADHVMRNARIQLFPFDSHAVRAVSAVMVPAAIALLHDVEEAQEWLDYSVEFLFTVYSPWGDAEGGWAEGAHYWMTGIAYLLEAANLMRSYIGLDLYARPFFQKTADFPFFTRAPNTRRATFGDDATLGDQICLKMGYNVRQFAGVTGNPAYQWYFETIRDADPGTEAEFYNWGWWDFRFDDLIYHHDFPAVTAAAPDTTDRLRHFRGIGWVCLQNDPANPEAHIQFNFKSSAYGSVSHSHADQNAFCLSAFGEDLAIQSGYYVAFGTTMHKDWRRQTRSKNAVLINGAGQYAGDDKARAIRAGGRILSVEEQADHILMRGDATAAYAEENPAITSVLRDIYFVHDSYFVVIDTVDADEPVTLDWLLHVNNEMELGSGTFRYTGSKAGFYGQALFSEAGTPVVSQESGFPGVDPVDYEGLPVSTCLKISHPAARRHRTATLLVPYPLSAPRRIFSFLDDQGYSTNLYFSDAEDRSFKISLEKAFEAGKLL